MFHMSSLPAGRNMLTIGKQQLFQIEQNPVNRGTQGKQNIWNAKSTSTKSSWFLNTLMGFQLICRSWRITEATRDLLGLNSTTPGTFTSSRCHAMIEEPSMVKTHVVHYTFSLLKQQCFLLNLKAANYLSGPGSTASVQIDTTWLTYQLTTSILRSFETHISLLFILGL